MKTPYDTAQELAAKKLHLAAEQLRRIFHLENDIETLDGLTASLRQTILDANADNPHDLCEMMVVQTRLLEGVFYYYFDKAKDPDAERIAMDTALRAQQQIVRTLNTWKNLKIKPYIVRKLIKMHERPFHAERTEQNAPLDE